MPVWYQGGGAPIMTPQVNLQPERLGREGRDGMHEAMREERPREDMAHAKKRRRLEPFPVKTGARTSDEARATGVGEAQRKGFKKASRVYTNDDVTRQNDKNGTVKYDGKTEKM